MLQKAILEKHRVFWKAFLVKVSIEPSERPPLSTQVVVSSCGQGSRTRSFYTLSETGSG